MKYLKLTFIVLFLSMQTTISFASPLVCGAHCWDGPDGKPRPPRPHADTFQSEGVSTLSYQEAAQDAQRIANGLCRPYSARRIDDFFYTHPLNGEVEFYASAEFACVQNNRP